MGIFSKVKSLLPVSSRVFHQFYGEFRELRDFVVRNDAEHWKVRDRYQNDLFVRMDEVIGASHAEGEHTRWELGKIEESIAGHDEKMEMHAWQIYRKEDESLDDAKKRFFSNLPQATGGVRLLQLGCAKLLDEFDSICHENGLCYWAGFGTLLGAVRHGGFIPWDDDTDLCMPRGDIMKLMELVRDSDRYRVTVVYDKWARCRQVRFKYRDASIPCFLDLFIFDYTRVKGEQAFVMMTADRKEMITRMEDSEQRVVWDKNGGYVDESDPAAETIRPWFDAVVEREYSDMGFLSWDKDAAQGIVWGVDNLYDLNNYDWGCDLSEVFPLSRVVFEGVECNAPNNIDKFLEEVYGDYMRLPRKAHFEHLSKEEYASLIGNEALESILQNE